MVVLEGHGDSYRSARSNYFVFMLFKLIIKIAGMSDLLLALFVLSVLKSLLKYLLLPMPPECTTYSSEWHLTIILGGPFFNMVRASLTRRVKEKQ